jgi:flagellar P-ring protein FlgI
MSKYSSGWTRCCTLVLVLLCSWTPLFGQTVRVKDIASIQGVRENQIVGLGIVTGLDGKGDSAGSTMTRQSLSRLLADFGIEVSAEDIRSRNTALVTVAATIPAFAAPGDRIDVHVASLADASDLSGGVLLQSALRAANGLDYAVAQGVVSTSTGSGASSTTAMIPGGAIMERAVASGFVEGRSVMLVLRNSDFTTATVVAGAIGAAVPSVEVRALNASILEIILGPDVDPVSTIAEIEQVRVVPDSVARVVIDERAGVIILGGDVRIGPVGISFRKNDLRIQPVSVYRDDAEHSFVIEETAAVSDFVFLLQELDVDTDTIIEMLKLMDRAGVLYGTLSIE